VYGSIDPGLKSAFWEELRQVGSMIYEAWLVCGDFNSLRFTYEKSDSNFHVKASKKFNFF
jgi:hypothetical protein